MKNLLAIGISPFLIAAFTSGLAENDITGAWKVTSVQRDYIDSAEPEILPSLVLFTDSYYSIFWTRTNTPTRAFDKSWSPTAEEKRRRFDEFIFNSGTYELNGAELRTYPMAARDPEFIGGYFDYKISWSGNSLILTLVDEYSYDGVQHPWVNSYAEQIHLHLDRFND